MGRATRTGPRRDHGPDAGLFLTNLRVRGWMDHETLSQHREDLCMVTRTGDRHGRPQVDYTVNPALGIPHMTGAEGATELVAHALPAWGLIAGNMCVSAMLAAERQPAHCAPTLGAHTAEVLADVAGLGDGEIGRLFDQGIVEAPDDGASIAVA